MEQELTPIKPIKMMTKKELLRWVEWANKEIVEYKGFIKDLNNILYTKYSKG